MTEKGQTILAIDDEPDMLNLLERILTAEGYKVILASDGVFGMQMVRDNSPDLILLDFIMPGPDGIVTLERIREVTDAPVIFVTAKHDMQTLAKSIGIGADDYIQKPFRPAELVERVNIKLEKHK